MNEKLPERQRSGEVNHRSAGENGTEKKKLMEKKVTDESMVVMDDLEDILMEDLDDILKEELNREPETAAAAGKTEKAAKPADAGTEDETADGVKTAAEEKTSGEKAPAAGEKRNADEINPDRTPIPVKMRRDPSAAGAEEKESAGAETAGKITGREDPGNAAGEPGKKGGTNEGVLLGMQDKAREPEAGAGKSGEKKAKKNFWKKFFIAAAVVLVVCLAGAYGYGVYYYSNHFLPATQAAGVRLDNLTVEAASEKLTEAKKAEDSKLNLIRLDGQTVAMDTSAMGITRTYQGLAEALAAQEKWTFPVSGDEWKELPLEYEISYSKEAAEQCLAALELCDPEKTEAPEDAHLEKTETGDWKVIPAYDGNTVDLEKLTAAVIKAVDGRETELNIREADAYRTAELREDDAQLNRNCVIENRIDQLNVKIDLGADTVISFTPEEFRSVVRDGIEKEESPAEILDAEKFDAYMDSLSRTYSTRSASGYRYFKSVTGARIAMESDYGWDMDREKTGELLSAVLTEAGQKIYAPVTEAELEACVSDSLAAQEVYKEYAGEYLITAAWTQTAVSHGERDTGESWVEVNLTQQKLYCVIDGEIKLESDVVSGLEMSKDRKTPAGFFAIRFKSTERDLVGYNSDGTESYRSHVHYWMPVYKNIGLHDATWRYSFGGKNYIWGGSHGCVNMPLKNAKELYGMVEKGMSVIFYRENKTWTTE